MFEVTKRLFIGGLAKSITEDEIESRFEKFGEVSEVNLVKKDSVNGIQEHCFAHFTYKGDEKQLKKLISTFNNTRWKNKTVRIELAKEDFLDRLAQEKKAEIKVQGKAKVPKREDVLMENFKKAGVEDFVKKKAVPGTAIEGEKNWVVGKYGRVLPVVYMRRRDKRKVTKFDPSKYSHHLKHIKDENGIHDSRIASFTWDMEEGNLGQLKKRQLHPKGNMSQNNNKNTKHRNKKDIGGYMFNFFGTEEDGDDEDQVYDKSSSTESSSSESGAMNQGDSESDSDISEVSGSSVPTVKGKKALDGRKEKPTNVSHSSNGNITAFKDTLQPGSWMQKPVISGELKMKDGKKVQIQGEMTFYSDKESFRDGSRFDEGSKYTEIRINNEKCVSDSHTDESDDDVIGNDEGTDVEKAKSESEDESADTDEICSNQQRKNQVKSKRGKSLNPGKLEDENAKKKKEDLSKSGGITNEKSSVCGTHHTEKAKISHRNRNVDDVGMKSDDTSGTDDSSSHEKERESDDDLADGVEIDSKKQKQREADGKGELLINNDDISKVFVKSSETDRGIKVDGKGTDTSGNKEKKDQLSVRTRESESDDSSTDGSSSSGGSSLKRKRETDEGLSDSERVHSLKKERMDGVAIEHGSPKKLKHEPTFINSEGKIGSLSLQGNLTGATFELLVLDRDILAKQGYNMVGEEGEENIMEDEFDPSGSDEDSDSDNSQMEQGKGKKKNKFVMPEFKGMNFFRENLKDGVDSEWKEKETLRGQCVSTDEMDARSEEGFIAKEEGQQPEGEVNTLLKKKKKKKGGDRVVGDVMGSSDGADVLKKNRTTQLEVGIGRVSMDTSDEDEKEQLYEERRTDEVLDIERQVGEENQKCILDDRSREREEDKRLSQKLLEDGKSERDADDESSDLEDLVNGENGSSSGRKRKKKKKHKEKQKEEKMVQKGKTSSEFTDSLSLINAVQNKYSNGVGHPLASNEGIIEENAVKETHEGLEGNELQSLKSTEIESSVSDGEENLKDTGKSFVDRMAEFGQKFIKKRKPLESKNDSKECNVAEKRLALPAKQQIGKEKRNHKESKLDISNQDTAEISNQKRLQAIKERQEELKNKQKAIQAALAKVDERKPSDAKKHMRFDSESEEDPEFAEEVGENKRDTSVTKATAKEPSLTLFADDNNEESGSDEDWFQVKPQFEGEKGQELLKLQRKFGDDERFKMDERFAEEEDDDDKESNDDDVAGHKHEENEDEDNLETEKTKNLSILENVLGNMLPTKKKTDDKKTKFRDIGQVRFDPSREDHEKFLLPRQEVSETSSKPKKKRKKKKLTEDSKRIMEAPLPEVSKEVFFDVKSDLTSALNQSEQVTFGFFNNDNEDTKEIQEKKEEEYIPPPSDFVWDKKRLPYDSSESEGETAETEKNKHESLSKGNPMEMEQKSSKSFFFGKNDHRLKDAVSQFCRPKDSPLKDNWEEKRIQLWAVTYKRHQKALRDNRQNRRQRRHFKQR